MSPEQAQGLIDEIDERADIYALGGILHSLLSFSIPVIGENPARILEFAKAGAIKPLSEKIPSDLRAIVDKATSYEKEERYQTVKDFSSDLINFLKGFSVTVKQDNYLELLMKLIKRNKTVSVGILIAVLALTIGMGLSLWQLYELKAEQLARKTDQEQSAPQFLAKSIIACETNDLKSALKLITTAVKFDSNLAPALILKAQLLIHFKKYKEAESTLESYVELKPSDIDSVKLLELCKKVQSKGEAYDITYSFYLILRRQEAGIASLNFAKSKDEKFKVYNAKVMKHFKVGLKKDKEGKLSLDLKGRRNINDLSPLKGMPLTSLNLAGSQVKDISPLIGMTLITLNLYKCPQVKDISPLKGMPLTSLNLVETQVVDISPLKGMPLNILILGLKHYPSKVKDITPLNGMPLTSLNLAGSQVKDISPLEGMPLSEFANWYEYGNITNPLPEVVIKLKSKLKK